MLITLTEFKKNIHRWRYSEYLIFILLCFYTRRNKCSLNQAEEGILFPRHMTTDMTFPIYRKAFCRTLPLTYISSGKMPEGYPVYLYKFQPKVFNSSLSENACYCPKDGCLPSGLSDISPCYYSKYDIIIINYFCVYDNSWAYF